MGVRPLIENRGKEEVSEEAGWGQRLREDRNRKSLNPPNVPGRVLGRVPGKWGLLGGLLGGLPFLCFSKESGLPHCSQQSSRESPFSWHYSKHSPRHCWGIPYTGFLNPRAGDPDYNARMSTGWEGGELNILFRGGNSHQAGRPQLSGTHFDKRTPRYEDWEVLSPLSVYFKREFPYVFVYCFSCRCLVELDLRQLGLPDPKELLPPSQVPHKSAIILELPVASKTITPDK